MPDRKKNTLGIMQDSIFFFRSFAVRKSVRNTAGFLGILPPPQFNHKNVSPHTCSSSFANFCGSHLLSKGTFIREKVARRSTASSKIGTASPRSQTLLKLFFVTNFHH